MNILRKVFGWLVALTVSATLTGCMAVQSPAIGVGQTIQALNRAVIGEPGTFVFMHAEQPWIVIGWNQGVNYGFIAIDRAGKTLNDMSQLVGCRACWEDANSFVMALQKNGWNWVPSGMIPAGTVTAIRQLGFLLALGEALPTFMMVPLVLPSDPMRFLIPAPTEA